MPQTCAPALRLAITSFAKNGAAILGPVQLQLQQGQTLGLVGPSGIGKTSILRIISGTETRFEGYCDVRGRIATVFQEPTLLPWRDLIANICIPTGAAPTAAQKMLEKVGLGSRGADFPGQLSLGQQRRVALARAFVMRPALMLLDEPFVSLDPDLTKEMIALFNTLRRETGVSSVFVSHVAAEAAQIADRIVTLGGSPARIQEP